MTALAPRTPAGRDLMVLAGRLAAVLAEHADEHDRDGTFPQRCRRGAKRVFWVLRNSARTIVVDTGFSAVGGARRKRTSGADAAARIQAANRMVRSGGGPALKARAVSITPATPTASSAAPGRMVAPEASAGPIP